MGRHSTRYPAEVRERAVRLVLDHAGDYGSQWSAMVSIAAKLRYLGPSGRSYGPESVKRMLSA